MLYPLSYGSETASHLLAAADTLSRTVQRNRRTLVDLETEFHQIATS
jgi:hypothetical protein